MSDAEPSGMEEKKDLFPCRVQQEIMRPYFNPPVSRLGLRAHS